MIGVLAENFTNVGPKQVAAVTYMLVVVAMVLIFTTGTSVLVAVLRALEKP
jgi:hypothetical protein